MTYTKNNPETIRTLFGTIADQYDRANNLMSFCLHKHWNHQLIKTIEQEKPATLLDLCAGTGEIGLSFLNRNPKSSAHLLDFCPEMLDVAKKKNTHPNTSFLVADAQEIPLPDASVDAVTIAYGIRNVKDPFRCFAGTYRVLKPHGIFAILELTRPKNPLLRFGHGLHLRYTLPLIGKLVTSNKQAYQYLCNSIQQFVQPETLCNQLLAARFTSVTITPLSGGIATLITAKK